MPMHLVAFSASVLTAGGLATFPPVPDPTVRINGDAIGVPAKTNRIIAVGALCSYGSQTQAQIHAPSLRELWFPDISPLVVGANFSATAGIERRFGNPLKLVPQEGMEYLSNGGGDGTTAGDIYGLVWLADGAPTPAKGDSYKLRASSGITQQGGNWINGPLVLSETLPVGKYQIIGFRAIAADLVAARLVFIGSGAETRPGVPGVAAETTVAPAGFGVGELGVIGEFDSETPPSVDVLGGASTAQTYEIDLIKTA